MTALGEIPLLLHEAHRRAIDDANRWRGKCVNHFARGELLIGKALAARDDSKPLPMLLSQRISRLSAMLGDQPKATVALDQFQQLSSHRNAVVHGSGKVFVDVEGKWLLTLELLDRSGASRLQLVKDEAEAHAKLLKATVDRLSAALRP